MPRAARPGSAGQRARCAPARKAHAATAVPRTARLPASGCRSDADAAARRKILEEIGIEYKGKLIPIGFYEDNYTESAFDAKTEYSSFSLVFVGDLNREAKSRVKLDTTSDDFGYFDRLPNRFVVKRFSDFEDVLQDWK